MSDPIEEGLLLAPKFDADGLVTCVATDAKSGELLMVAHMNAEALKRTVEDAYGYVRVRGEISGFKGPSPSGHCYFRLKDDKAVLAPGATAHPAPAA